MTLKDFRYAILAEMGARHVSVEAKLDNDGVNTYTAYIIQTRNSPCEAFTASSVADVLNKVRAFYNIPTAEPHDIEIEETRSEP